MKLLSPAISAKCRRFVVEHWGKEGLQEVKDHPVSWVRHRANPHLKLLRRRRKNVPLIAVRGTVNRIHLALSTEKDAKGA
jgi:predicted lipid carrier protein YhbT